MKKANFSVSATLISLLFFGCHKDHDTSPIDPSKDFDALNKNLGITGSYKDGTFPNGKSANLVRIINSPSSASITADNTLFIPFVFSSDNTATGIYLQVKGANGYWDIPINKLKSTAGSTSAKVIPVLISDYILNGTFDLYYSIYDNLGNISNPSTLIVEITSPVKLCENGASLGLVKGNDGITVKTYELGDGAGWVSVSYNMFTVKDRMDIKFNGTWIRSTGNILGNGEAPPINLCSKLIAGDGFVSGTNSFNFFYLPEKGKKLDVYVSGCLEGGTEWNFQIKECPKEFITLGVHSNVAGNVTIDSGHGWVSLTKDGKTTFYGLWPDTHPKINKITPLESDIRVNLENGAGPYRRYYPLTENQYNKFTEFIGRKKFWTPTYNCSSFAKELVAYVTGETINASDYVAGFETPRQLGTSISQLEKNSPTADYYSLNNQNIDRSSCSFCTK